MSDDEATDDGVREDWPETLPELDEAVRATAGMVCHEAMSIRQGIQEETDALHWATRRLIDLVTERRLWREEG